MGADSVTLNVKEVGAGNKVGLVVSVLWEVVEESSVLDMKEPDEGIGRRAGLIPSVT